MPIVKYDWIQLKKNFFDSDFNDVAGFLQQAIGKIPESDGNVAQQVKGWAEEKKEWRRIQIKEIENEARKALIEKLKINLEELLAAKKLSFSLMTRFLSLFGKTLEGKEELTEPEKKFVNSFPVGKVDTITKWLQIELGLPTNVMELKDYSLGQNGEAMNININFQLADIINNLTEDERRQIITIVKQGEQAEQK